MKLTAIGILEINSVAQGLLATDHILKAANVKLLKAQPICPGKFIIIVAGEIGSISNALDVGIEIGGNAVVEHYCLGNLHPSVAQAMLGAGEVPEGKAMGIIETFTASGAIVGADISIKAAVVNIVDIRIGGGLGGKAYAIISGDVASVEIALETVGKNMQEVGPLANLVAIPAPYQELWETIV